MPDDINDNIENHNTYHLETVTKVNRTKTASDGDPQAQSEDDDDMPHVRGPGVHATQCAQQ